MKKRTRLVMHGLAVAIAFVNLGIDFQANANVLNGWEVVDGNYYWYENGIKQGIEGRGKEIYDPDSDAWYWLDAVEGGKKATNKDLYQESEAGEWAENEDGTGKWVRYDENGHMIKGWYVNENGTYYFDLFYGTMAKGTVIIDGQTYTFDSKTGILQSEASVQNGWVVINGNEYWYENGVKQGTEGRGKEIYDPDSDAWYWLDAVEGGKKATSKDLYQESEAGIWAETENGTGKWVRYDENGHMVKGWYTNENGTYYFDLTYGTMAKGQVTIDEKTYQFDNVTGTLIQEVKEHTWVDATCTQPKTCSTCGATEGESLGHTLKEANYQQAATCIVCGEAEGEPLQADFEKYGLECNVELNKIYDGTMICGDNLEEITSPKVVFSNYKVFDSDDTHAAKEGYEWKSVDVTLYLYDENAIAYADDGWTKYFCYQDYYLVGKRKDTYWDENDVFHFSVNMNGEEYTECMVYQMDKTFSKSHKSWIIAFTVNYMVPKGYDGCVYGLRNGQIEWGDDQYFYEIDNTDTLLFRFKNMEDMEIPKEIQDSEINLTDELATDIALHFLVNVDVHLDNAVVKFFDVDDDNKINMDELSTLFTWVTINYDSYDSNKKLAADFLAGKVNLPESLYIP